MNELELKAAYMAMGDYRALVAKKKCFNSEDIAWEVRFWEGYQDILKSTSKLIERRQTKWDAETLQE